MATNEDSHRRLVFATTATPPAHSRLPSYSLLSLPPALLALLSSATPPTLEIRGHTTDAAVLVTPTETYSLRGVQNSNSLLLCSTTTGAFAFRTERGEESGEGPRKRRRGEDDSIEIEATLHETLEVVQGVARTERLGGLLRGSEYAGEDAEEDRNTSAFLTYANLQALLPASDKAITAALRAHRVVTLGPYLRPIAPSYLLKILPTLLSTFTPRPSTPIKKEKASKKDKTPIEKKPVIVVEDVEVELDEMVTALDAVDCGETVARAVVEWFGAPKGSDVGGLWKMRVGEIVREVGIGLLESGGYGYRPLKPFEASWSSLCASFSPLCSLSLLAGTHVISSTLPPQIKYFPVAHLSPDPTVRFDELFAVRDRWSEAEMTLFLDDLVAGEKKKREAMVLKFVRKVKDEKTGQMVWTSRKMRK
ncbi:hypothetical protein RQP46_008510 [Phenoliferia psychrophenolica]